MNESLFYSVIPKTLAHLLALLTYFWEVSGSNIGLDVYLLSPEDSSSFVSSSDLLWEVSGSNIGLDVYLLSPSYRS